MLYVECFCGDRDEQVVARRTAHLMRIYAHIFRVRFARRSLDCLGFGVLNGSVWRFGRAEEGSIVRCGVRIDLVAGYDECDRARATDVRCVDV